MDGFSIKRLGWIRLFASIGIAATGYPILLLISGKIDCIACGLDRGCVDAFKSTWAYWLGIPVILPGFLLHLLIWTVACPCFGTKSQHQRLVALGTGAMLAGLSAFWFIGILAVIEHTICLYCCAFHLASIGIFAFTIRPFYTSIGTCFWKPALLTGLLFGCVVIGQMMD